MNTEIASVSSKSTATYETDNTTAEEYLENIDTQLYIMADEITNINSSIDKLIKEHYNYHILMDICSKAPSENYFEYIYNQLRSISLH
jgi:hypothetical protein